MNACFAIDSPMAPEDLLSVLHDIEADAARERVVRWGPRTLDMDLLAFGSLVSPALDTWRHWADLPIERQRQEQPETLILPHPRLQDRAFVLKPLMDIAPEWQHPVLGLSVREMLAALGDHSEITPIE